MASNQKLIYVYDAFSFDSAYLLNCIKEET